MYCYISWARDLGEDGLERSDLRELHVGRRAAVGKVGQPRLQERDDLRNNVCYIIYYDFTITSIVLWIAAVGEVCQPRLQERDDLQHHYMYATMQASCTEPHGSPLKT
jgi:hypothetical protein